jgi:mono/diheme cytochrome c family protein
MALVAGSVAVGVALAGSKSGSTAAAGSTNKLVVGKALYRKFCGQCHALSEAQSAGFGCNDCGLGTDGGPSFNNLKVPYDLSVQAITGSFAGHEIVIKKMDFPQIYAVSAFTAAATSSNPYLARESDG